MHINIEAVKDSDGSISIKAAEDMMLQAADVMNIKSSTHKETAGNIYMNTSAQAAAAASSASPIVTRYCRRGSRCDKSFYSGDNGSIIY